MSTTTTRADALRCGMIGCGAFAMAYHIPPLLTDNRVRISAICDASPTSALQSLASEIGVTVTQDITTVLRSDVDFVVISTPHALHAEHVEAALEHGKHVLVDKPFVLSSKDAERLARAASRGDRVCGVAFNRRLDRAYNRGRQLVKEGLLGEIRHVESVQLGYPTGGWYTDPALGGGGPFIGRTAHLADIVPWLLDRRPMRLAARLAPATEGSVDNGGWLSLEFAGGLTWNCTTLSFGYDMWDEVRVFGDKAVIALRRPKESLTEWELLYADEADGQTVAVERGAVRSAAVDFIDAILHSRDPVCSFATALPSVRTIEAAYTSVATEGSWVEL